MNKEETPSEPIKTGKTLQGRVVKAKKIKKTITVLVERREKHPLYKKIITKSKKFLVHDPSEVCGEGDLVEISSCRKQSKRKAFALAKVLRRSAESTQSDAQEKEQKA